MLLEMGAMAISCRSRHTWILRSQVALQAAEHARFPAAAISLMERMDLVKIPMEEVAKVLLRVATPVQHQVYLGVQELFSCLFLTLAVWAWGQVKDFSCTIHVSARFP